MVISNMVKDLVQTVVVNETRPTDVSKLRPIYYNSRRNKVLFLKKEDAVKIYNECKMVSIFTGYWVNDRQGFYNTYAKKFIFFDSVRNIDIDECDKVEATWDATERGRLVGDLICFMDDGIFKVYEVQGFYIKFNGLDAMVSYRYPISYETPKWWE